MDDQAIVNFVNAYEHSVAAGVAIAVQKPQLINARTSLEETALHLLVLGKSITAIRSILALGADLNVVCIGGDTPLTYAASQGDAEIVQCLLAAGAAISVQGQREPCLYKAARSGNVEVVRLFLDVGTDINEQAEFSETPLHIAAEQGHATIVKLLLERGADPLLKSDLGGTALEIAQAGGHEQCIALLSPKH